MAWIEYKVSVRLMTYNHEPFIRQAMDSIMMQKTDFNVEVVIGDDFSTDNTLRILKEYNSKDNIHINILQRRKGDSYWEKRKQLGRLYNFSNILENCKGKYIALLDGDDYWNDPLKLQKQVDFLEENDEYVISFHDAKIVDADNKSLNPHTLSVAERRDRVPQENVLGLLMPTLTVVFRNHLIKEIPEIFYQVKNGDTFFLALVGQNGKSKFHSDITPATYRMHAGGIWSTLSHDERVVNLYNTYHSIYRVIDNPRLDKLLKKKVFSLSLQSILLVNGIGNRLSRYINSYKLISLSKDNFVEIAVWHKIFIRDLIKKKF